ncbi:N-6 DNA methylase [Candidatus Tisiphia endosymbiont of Ditula angustiorana]|uniref:N-6 DNA methylase n=1 Tax=Candidatus Tisiphia endosymbiont of Ditula angustiorana TaxID=3066272 RepID=UPI00312C87CF
MKYSNLVERDIETAIDNELRYLKWNDDSKNLNSCNVYKQRAKTEKQEKLLGRKRPDYILYRDNSDEPIAIIEAKKPFEDINKAQEQGIEYAKILNAPIVFVTDGIYTKTYHIKKQANLILNNEEVDELLNQSTLLNFLQDNIYNSIDRKVLQSREELISIFKTINNDLRDMGIRGGLDRVDLFSNILFLKVISELAEMNDEIINLPPKDYLWNNFKNKKGLDLVDFLNKQAFDYFKKSYGGEVLSKMEILNGKEHILNNIIASLDDLWLSDTSTDIKGDAFEYFLRNYGGAETDFGEYFTPRHIVKTMVKLLNPQFGEKVYDGFCGTGGMLTESFKYIKRRMPLNQNTIEQLKNETVFGGEFSTMFRIAKMNMILAGDGHSNITRQDSYEKKQTNKFDVVITNIPFGSKRKTDYLSQYEYNGKSAEVCGILHCLDALNSQNENARAGIIVPEGILFNGNKAYTQLRRDLVEKHSLENVISLPKGAFADASIKSNILIVKNKQNKSKNHIWYFDLRNDGYTLNKARKKIHGQNDIDILLSETSLNIDDIDRLKKINFDILYQDRIQHNQYVLLINQYKEQTIDNFAFQKFSLKELEKCDDIEFLKGNGLSKTKIDSNGKYECILYGELYTLYNNLFIKKIYSKTDLKGKVLSQEGDVLIPATTTADADGIAIARTLCKSNVIIGSDINIIRIHDKNRINPQYLSLVLSYPLKSELAKYARGANILHLNNTDIKKIKIPVPRLEEQENIVKLYQIKEQEIEDFKNKIKSLEMDMKNSIVDAFFQSKLHNSFYFFD